MLGWDIHVYTSKYVPDTRLAVPSLELIDRYQPENNIANWFSMPLGTHPEFDEDHSDITVYQKGGYPDLYYLPIDVFYPQFEILHNSMRLISRETINEENLQQALTNQAYVFVEIWDLS